MTPYGEEVQGFKISIVAPTDMALVERTFSDIEAICKAHPENYKVSEEKDSNGKFKSYTVTT